MTKYLRIKYLMETLGLYYYNKTNFKAASNVFKLMHIIDPHNISVCINLGASYFHINEVDKSLKLFEKALKLNSLNVALNHNLVRIYTSLSLDEKVQGTYDRLIEAGSDVYESYVNKAFLYGKKEVDSCISCYLKALELSDKDLHVIHNLGLAYFEKKDFINSEIYLLKALKRDENNCNFLNGYGFLLLGLKKYDEAINYLNKCIVIDSEFHHAYSSRGYCLLRIGEFDKAILDINKAIELNSELAEAYEVRSLYNLLLNKKDLALKDWEIAKNIDRGDYYSIEIEELKAEFEE